MAIACVFDYSQMDTLSDEIKKLHMAHGVKSETDRTAFFADELQRSGYTFNQIINGLTVMRTAEINKITLPLILRFISENIPKKAVSDYSGAIECRYCNDSGMVTLVDKNKDAYAFACVCNQQSNFPRWNGEFNFKHYEYYSADKYYKRGAYSI